MIRIPRLLGSSLHGIITGLLTASLVAIWIYPHPVNGHHKQQTCVQPAPGLIHWWPGDNNTNDVIGFINGTLEGNTAFAQGIVGNAFSFDGNSGSAVLIRNSIDMQIQDFTIEAWIKRGDPNIVSYAGDGCILCYGDGGYGLAMASNGSFGLTKIGYSGTSHQELPISDTSFHHVAITKSGSTVILFVDGQAYPATEPYDPGFAFYTNMAIGTRGDNFNNTFLGFVDEPTIYNRALTEREIDAIYNAGSLGKCEPVNGIVNGVILKQVICSSVGLGVVTGPQSWDRTKALKVPSGSVVNINIKAIVK